MKHEWEKSGYCDDNMWDIDLILKHKVKNGKPNWSANLMTIINLNFG